MDDLKNLLTEEEIRAKMVTITKELGNQARSLSMHRLPHWPELDQQR